jgi:GNAT superfamily N-acetyltransferase
MDVHFTIVTSENYEEHEFNHLFDIWKSQKPITELRPMVQIKYIIDGKEGEIDIRKSMEETWLNDNQEAEIISKEEYLFDRIDFTLSNLFQGDFNIDDTFICIMYLDEETITPIGYTVFTIETKCLEYVSIHPDYRGRGLCKRLMDHTVDFIRNDLNLDTWYLQNAAGDIGKRCYTSSGMRYGYHILHITEFIVFYVNIEDIGDILVNSEIYTDDEGSPSFERWNPKKVYTFISPDLHYLNRYIHSNQYLLERRTNIEGEEFKVVAIADNFL